MVAVYAPFGVLHVGSAGAFLPIMPPGVPHPRTVVVLTGCCEIAGAIGLLLPRTRKAAGAALALYAAAVFPANIYHALAHRHVPPQPAPGWYHGPRQRVPPGFGGGGLNAGGGTRGPARRRKAA